MSVIKILFAHNQNHSHLLYFSMPAFIPDQSRKFLNNTTNKSITFQLNSDSASTAVHSLKSQQFKRNTSISPFMRCRLKSGKIPTVEWLTWIIDYHTISIDFCWLTLMLIFDIKTEAHTVLLPNLFVTVLECRDNTTSSISHQYIAINVKLISHSQSCITYQMK